MIQAIIFDLDGTVLDNEGIWEDVFREVARKHQILNSKVQNNSHMHEPGIGLRNNWRKYVKDDKEVEEAVRESWRLYQESEPRVMNGVEEVISWAKEKGWVTALTTGSEWYGVEKELEQLNLYLAFDVTTTGEEVMMQKPDPEIYVLTAQKMGVEPKQCVVVEDSVAGVMAGAAAGMAVVGLVSDYADEKTLKKAGAKWVVSGLTEIPSVLNNVQNA